jgi:invasion protein IalB
VGAGVAGVLAEERPYRVPGADGQAPARLAQANAAGQLPGGATALRETHGDWIVACTSGTQTKVCGLSQQQADRRSGQRVLAVEVGPPTTEGTQVTLVLPFGVQLDKGAVVQVDEGPPSGPFAFKTCLPVGCVVEFSLDRQGVETWRKGGALSVKTVVVSNGKEALFTVPLKGFSSALDRVTALAN